MVGEAGRYWTYSGGATALLARLIAKGAGQAIHAFARAALFDPLGIGPTEWLAGPDGEAFAASKLRGSPRDLARLGVLMLNGGAWGDRQVVSASWIVQSTAQIVGVDEFRRYGYQWYVGDYAFGPPKGWAPGHLERWWGAMGEGGQRLFMLPGLDLVVAITADNYGADDQWMPPTRAMREVVLPSVV